MLKIFKHFRFKKEVKEADELIDELDRLYEQLKAAEEKENQIDTIMRNQVNLAKELSEEKQKSL